MARDTTQIIALAGVGYVIYQGMNGNLPDKLQQWWDKNIGKSGSSSTGGGTPPPGGAVITSQGATFTCKGETRARTWDQIDSELHTAGYGGPFDHSQTEADTYQRTCNS